MFGMLILHEISKGIIVAAVGKAPDLDPDIESEIQIIWDAEAAKPECTLFNGLTFSLTSLSTSRIEGHFVEYRRLVAQHVQPTLFPVLGVRPLGVSGLLSCSDGIVFGCRNMGVRQDPGSWELAPSGSVDVTCVGEDGNVDIHAQVLVELVEETGINRSNIVEIKTLCLIEDDETHVVDAAIFLRTEMSGAEVIAAHASSGGGEYKALVVVAPNDVSHFIDQEDGSFVEVSRLLLGHFGYLS